jgi:hypothetical protein
MKTRNQLFVILSLIVLTACLNTTSRKIFNPIFTGKNKVFKTNETAEIPQELTNEKDHNFPEILTSDIVEDSVKNLEQTGEFPEQLTLKNDRTSIKELKKENLLALIEDVSHPISVIPGKKIVSDKPTTGDAVGVAAIFIVLLVLALLLCILLFYLMIKAINDAADEATEGCYVATMAYGDYDHPKVKTLRLFRDRFLAKYSWGNRFIGWYYRHSPSFVQFYKHNRFVNTFLRANLNVFEFLIRPFFK